MEAIGEGSMRLLLWLVALSVVGVLAALGGPTYVYGATFDASKIVSTDANKDLVSYAGTTPCSSQAMTALSSAGVATCTSVDVSWLTGTQNLTKSDDTNVTLTLGGTPAGALLKAVSLTLGWTGTLGLSRGGTAADLTLTGGAGQVLKQTSVGGAVTVATVAASEISSGAALTKADDTNVTLTLGGSPTTALLSAASITAGWSGQLSPARGGTGLSAAVTGLLLGNGTSYAAYAGTSCTNQFPRSLNASGVATCASVANADLAGSIAASKLVGTDIATVGTITAGTWNATVIGTTYGGTGGNTTATSGRYLKGNGTTWATSSGSASGVGACAANSWASTLNSDAAPTCTQPAASNLSNGTTGSGAVVLETTPTLVTPVLGVATATSINKVALTAPATAATLTIANNKTLTASNTLTLTGTDASSVAFGSGGTVAYTANKLSAFAATTSAELAGVISDETGGSGVLVFNSGPLFTGQVKIGTTNWPSTDLGNVAGRHIINGTDEPAIILWNEAAAAANNESRVTVGAKSGAGATTIGGMQFAGATLNATDRTGIFIVRVSDSSGGMNERTRVTSGGNVHHKGTNPSMGACGTSPAVNGSDVSMMVTVGTGGVATSCAVTFAETWTAAPVCIAQNDTDRVAYSMVTTTTTLTITATAAFTASSKFHIHCLGF